jgi:hypothetical protein
MDTTVKTLNIIRASALNQHEFVELLEETESEQGEIIYHTNIRWQSRRSLSLGGGGVRMPGRLHSREKSCEARINLLWRCMALSKL